MNPRLGFQVIIDFSRNGSRSQTHVTLNSVIEGLWWALCIRFFLEFDELRALTHSLSGIELPKEVKNDYVIAEATLFDSPLANKA